MLPTLISKMLEITFCSNQLLVEYQSLVLSKMRIFSIATLLMWVQQLVLSNLSHKWRVVTWTLICASLKLR